MSSQVALNSATGSDGLTANDNGPGLRAQAGPV